MATSCSRTLRKILTAVSPDKNCLESLLEVPAAAAVVESGKFGFNVQIDLGIFGLQSLTMIALFSCFVRVRCKASNRFFAMFDTNCLLKFEFIFRHTEASTMITDTAECLEGNVEKALMVDPVWPNQCVQSILDRILSCKFPNRGSLAPP